MKRRKRQSTQKTMSCRGCKQIFLGASGLQKHLRQSQRCRNKIKVLEQKQMGQHGKSVLNSRLINPSAKHTSKNVIKCKHPNCTEFFETIALMKDHIQTHSNDSKTEDKSAANISPKKVFACSKCKSEFTSSARLHAHSIQCKRNGPCFTCNLCGVMFLSQNALTQHFNKLHKVLKSPEPTKSNKSDVKTTVFTCYLCEESRTGWKEMLQHKEQCRNKQIEVKPTNKDGKTVVSFRCKLCDTYHNSFTTLRRHVKLDHVKDRFKCDKCQKQIFMLKNFQNHKGICKSDDQKALDSSISTSTESVVSDVHDSNYDATTEATDSVSDVTVNSSDDESSKKQKFECSFCSKKFQLQIALKQHLQVKHKSSVPGSNLIENIENCVESVSCEACEKKYPPQIILSHLKEQHDLALYRCRKCNFMTSSAQGVKVHIHMEHRGISFDRGFQTWNDHSPLRKPNDRKLYCRFCVMGGCEGQQHWHEHMLRLHPHKLLSCPECAMKMPSVQAFVQHIMKKHYERSPKLLGSMFEQTRSQHDDNKKSEEDVTVVEAKDEKQELCQQCDFKTGNKYELEQHVLQKHLKSLTCPNCHRTFKNLHWYSKHMAHCDEFKCDLCKFKCKEINVFEVHKLEKHKVKEAVVKAILLSAEEMDVIMGKTKSSIESKSENKYILEPEKVHKRKKKLKTKDVNEVVEKKQIKEEKRIKVVKHVRKKTHRILTELMTTTDDDTDASSKKGRTRNQEKPPLKKKIKKNDEKVPSPTAGVSDKTTAMNENKNDAKPSVTITIDDNIVTEKFFKEEKEADIDAAELNVEKAATVADWVVNSTNSLPQENIAIPPLPMTQTESPKIQNIEEKSTEIQDENRPNIFSVFSGSGETWDSSDAEYTCEVCRNLFQKENHLINHKRFKHIDVYNKEKIARDAYKQYLVNKKNEKLSLRKKEKLAKISKKVKRRGRPISSMGLIKLTKSKISMFSKKPISKYHCFKCDKSFLSYRGLAVHKGHMHVRSNNEFDKKRTPYLMGSNKNIQEPPKEKEEKSAVKTVIDFKFRNACSLCSESFESSERLKMHKILLHSRYECDKCDEYFPHKSMYILHRRVHGRITYKCKDCTRVFQMEKAYIMHKHTHVTPNMIKKPSSIYEKIFKSGGEFPFYCEKCNLGYFWVSDLALHSTSGVCGIIPPFKINA